MAYVPNSGSVVAFQNNPGSLQASITGTVAITGSVISVPAGVQSVVGTVTANQGTNPWVITGSVQGSFSPAANQSVSGTVGASIIGAVPVNVQSSVAVAIISGSIAASFTPPANQSVSGTVQTDVRSSVATVIIGGSIAASFTPPANQSVSGTVGASLIGLSPVSVSNFPTTQNVSGSVVATQGTTPWIVTGSVQATAAANQSVSGTVGASLIGLSPVSVSNFPTTQNISGSVAAFQQGTIITSLVSTIPSSVLVGTSIFGQLPAGTAVLGSVAALQGSNPWIITGSVQGTFTPAANQSVSGTVGASIVGQLPAGTAVLGSVAALQGTNPWNIAGSVAAFQAGTNITSISGTVPVVGSINSLQQGAWSTSIQGTVSVLGTVPVTQSGTWITSISGVAYAEDSGHTDGNPGLFTFGVRNDTVASFVSANTDYTPIGLDSAGRNVTKPFAPDQASVIGHNSIVAIGVGAGSVLVMQAPGVGLKNYLTDFNIANTGTVTTIVQFNDTDASIVGRTIAPAGGGSNHSFAVPLTTPSTNKAIAVQLISASSVFITVSGYKAP